MNRAFATTAIALVLVAAAPPEIGYARQVSEARPTADQSREGAAGCALPSDPNAIAAALDAAITGPADKDRTCMTALLTPDARITLVSVGANGGANRKVLSLDDWIARTKASGHLSLEEKQLKFRIDRFGIIAHLWSMYSFSDGHAAARGINSIQAIKEAGGWRVTSIMMQAESDVAPLPEKYIP